MTKPEWLTGHWTAGIYIPNDIDKKDYQILVTFVNGKAVPVKMHNFDIPPRPGFLEHTWHRNTGNIGIAICGMYNATENNFGICPINEILIDGFCLASAEALFLKQIDTSHFLTHAEYAIKDGYYPQERWDLATLKPTNTLTEGLALETARGLRKRIKNYKIELMQRKREIRPWILEDKP